jgi:thioredoxin reductase (NADPH)
MDKYDVLIVGGAVAGLSAAIYTGRRALRTAVITKDIGGQATSTTEIENYPGIMSIGGFEFSQSLHKQAEKYGAELHIGEVNKIEKTDDGFLVKSSAGEYEALSLILAFGLDHRKLNLPKEKELTGRGISYCATCDGPFFRNKVVAVVGGGNSAFDAAEYLANIANKVYLLVRSDEYKAEQVLIDSVKSKKNVDILNFTEVKEIIGEGKLQKLVLNNRQTQEEKEIEADGLFVEIGYQTQTAFVKDLIDVNDQGYIKVDNENKTLTPGIFAAGDVTDTPYKQAVISAGEGAKAALSAARYLQSTKGRKISLAPDWKR